MEANVRYLSSNTPTSEYPETIAPKSHIKQKTNLSKTSQSCGYGPCHPRWLQVFLRPKVFIATVCCLAFVQGYAVNGVNNANTASYEKRFFLSSSRVGAVSSSYDFTAAILAIPISYFGAHVHKPRMLGFMAIVFAIGAFIMLLPHLTTDAYYYGQEDTNMCNTEGNGTKEYRNSDEATLPNYLYVLCFGMALMGIGGTTLYSVGTAAVDESVTRQSSAFALGLFYAMASLGPAFGFIIGATFLKIYVDVDAGPQPDFDETDARWIGAWWMGFVIPSVLFAIVAVVLFAFPRIIPVSQEVVQSRIDQSQAGLAEEVTRPGFGNNIWDLPRATWNLLKNLPFLFVTFSGVSDGLISSGFATFTAKLIQQQFNKSVAVSNLVLGAVTVAGAVGGQLVGGYVCKRANLKVPGMLRWCAACSIAMAILTSSFWLRCDDAPIAGVNRQYQNGMVALSITNTTADCNAACNCTDQIHEPVCGADSLEYLTPCHAGCHVMNNDKIYTNCSCIDVALGDGMTTASPGRCDKSCVVFYIAMVLYFLTMFTMFLDWAPRSTITLRCVPETQRTYALGVQWVFVRLLGTVPGPIVLGAVVDLACKYHRQSTDDNVYACLVYDRYELSRNIFLLSFFIKLTTASMYLLALFFYKPPTTLPESYDELPADEIRSQGQDDYQVSNENEAEFVGQNTSSGIVNKSFVDETEASPGSQKLHSTEL